MRTRVHRRLASHALLSLCVALVALVASSCAPCSAYRYSTCPTHRCERNCQSSACGPGPGALCTDDCDGAGSCFDPHALSSGAQTSSRAPRVHEG